MPTQLNTFDRGRKAGQDGVDAPNPFIAGSADHRNYALGLSFGAGDAVERREFKAARPEADAPDHDETD